MRPDITKYLDLFQFLRDYYSFRKHLSARFSYQSWAQELGIKNKSYLRFVALGRRPVSDRMASGFIQNLELKGVEAEYFELLRLYSQSKTPVQRNLVGKRMITLLRDDVGAEEIEPHYDFLSTPLLPRLLTLLSFRDLNQDPENLSRLLMISIEDVQKGLERLHELDFTEKTEGRYKPKQKSFKISDQLMNLGLRNFYHDTMDAAKAAIQLKPEERRFRSLFLAMNESEFNLYIERLNEFAKEQLANHDFETLENRKLYQIGFTAHPVTR